MKAALIVSGDELNVFLTPETDAERMALKFVAAGTQFEVASNTGNFYGGEYQRLNMGVSRCRGGWLRGYSDDASIILVKIGPGAVETRGRKGNGEAC